MKSSLIPFLRTSLAVAVATVALAGNVLADDVVIFDIRAGKEKTVQRVSIELYEDAAPNTVANFKKLVRDKFYNGLTFHRVFPHQMLQAGDPLSAKKDRKKVGTGGPGYTIPGEINRHKHVPGTVAMARLPDKINPARVSNGSQFYITLVPMPNLDGQYTVFGKVLDGMEALDALSAKATDTNDNPVERIVITRAQVVPREQAQAIPLGHKTGWRKIFPFGRS